ncbi:hypothetical protein CR513_38220, partial [Mucuna pruriens]
MLFVLKNTGVTYQCLMDKIFKEQIDGEIKVYVDDMVVKSPNEDWHYKALASYSTCEAPRNVKELQQLVGRITILIRFLSSPTKTRLASHWSRSLERNKGLPWGRDSLPEDREDNPYSHHDSRKLRPYFQSYEIMFLKKPDLARRMVRWYVELLEFDISYERRGHIKAQVLIKFITMLTAIGEVEDKNNEWRISIDKASNQIGSDTKIILQGLNEVMIEQSLWFEFRASNKQAQYKLLLVEIKLAKKLGAKILTAKSDSQLMID